MDIVTWYSQERDWYNSYTKKMEDRCRRVKSPIR